MKRPWILVLLWVVAAALAASTPQANSSGESGAKPPTYTKDGDLKFPANYREWVYLSSGVDMSYSPNRSTDHSMFDNVFVNTEAYRAFLQTGSWPDKTMLVLEARMAGS